MKTAEMGMTSVSSYQVTWNLVVQQLVMRYRQAWLGMAWMVLTPLLTMSVMSLALSTILQVKASTLLAHIMVSTLPFSLFQSTVATMSSSLVGYQDIIRRHNVSRLVFPLSAMLLCIVEYLVGSLSLVVLGPLLHMRVGWTLLVMPLGFLCICVFALGLGLLGAIGTVYFRDLGQVIQVLLTLLYWVTPVVYTLAMIPEAYQDYYYGNPLVSMLAMYTQPLLANAIPAGRCFVIGPCVALVIFALGYVVFHRHAPRVVFYL